jgi:hypothetical protein
MTQGELATAMLMSVDALNRGNALVALAIVEKTASTLAKAAAETSQRAAIG